MTSRDRTRSMVTAALLAALLGASAWIAVPTPVGVPFTFQTFVVILIALLLPPGWAAASVGTYLALGFIGVPVFAGFRGGPGVLLGPTGGFLFGFLVGATLGSAARTKLAARMPDAAADAVGAFVVVACTYLAGWGQLMAVAHIGPAASFAAGVAPFVLFDVLKAVVVVGVAAALRRSGVMRH